MNPLKIISLFLLVIFISIAGANNNLHRADSLYTIRDYKSALSQYKQVLKDDRFLRDDYILNFKLGICYYSYGDYEAAYETFTQLSDDHPELEAYRDYYLFLATLRSKEVSYINKLGSKYLTEHKKHYLADSLRLHLADYQFSNKNYHAAANHYGQLVRKRSFKKQKSYLNKQIALCKYYVGQEKAAIKLMYNVIKKYPGTADALDVVKLMEQDEEIVDKYFFTISDVYLKHNYLTVLRAKLENYVHKIKDPVLKEKARFYILRVYYYKGDYQSVLFGLKNMLTSLQNNLLKPRIELMIARSYLKLEMNDEAAIAYIKYAENNPRRRLADDAMWKAAWIYEEKGSLKNALDTYEKLIVHWPSSSYSKESRFRIGLCYYRLGWFATAEQVFSELSQNKTSKFHQHRGNYWLAKTYNESGKQHESRQLFIELGSEVFESYYATKSYIMFQDEVNSIYHIDLLLQNQDDPLSIYMDTQMDLMNRFKSVFLIDDLLGKDYAFKELANQKYFPKEMAGWVSLAETYKRLGAYNRAYRVYDHIDKAYFSDLLNYEKPFLLKEAYPLYFDEFISIYAGLRQMDQNLVLAIIRAESAYDQNAHSWADAYGLMQLIPRTASQVAKELKLSIFIPDNLFDPETNINLGTFYLKKLLNRFDNRVSYALAAYNAGPHRVDKWQKINDIGEEDLFVENIEFSQTRNYVRKVLRNYWIYEILSQSN
jgi:soluble lytic murein transglycosylase